MYEAQIEKFADQAVKKVEVWEKRPMAICIGGILAGAYVGIGIILIMVLGTDVPPEARKIVMGATFGIALILVIFAGAELFTGYTMYASIGVLQRKLTVTNAIKICTIVWVTNLAGAILLALMYKLGGGSLVKSPDTILQVIAYKKMNAESLQLFFNGILCNWLVCLAIWMAARMEGDAAKCIGIFWCLLGFIASGYEHSVANMTIFSIALIGPSVEGINIIGAAHNLFWVTLGNTFSGVIFMGFGYWYMSEPLDKTLSKVTDS